MYIKNWRFKREKKVSLTDEGVDREEMYHDEQHDMTSESSRLSVVDLERGLLPDLCESETRMGQQQI